MRFIANVVAVFVIIFLAVPAIAGLATFAAQAAPAPSIEDTTWVLESYGPADGLQPVLKDFQVTLQFNKADGRIGGSAGVNRYFGTCRLDGDRLTVTGPIGMTMMAGPKPAMDQEQMYLSILQKVDSFRVEGGKLTLAAGGLLLVFHI